MEKSFIKNIEFSKAMELADLIEYQQGKVVSVTFAQNDVVSITQFAFAKGEGISTHAASGDAMVYILDGMAEITIGENKLNAVKGQIVVMPANIPHGLEAIDNFKMLLVVVRK
ncbi:MAG: Cupin 2 conserved barrel domain protein [Firmicutes bacterium]|nr:Cupin 2 conserved barrel domain protein [Bacillota bacterium]